MGQCRWLDRQRPVQQAKTRASVMVRIGSVVKAPSNPGRDACTIQSFNMENPDSPKLRLGVVMPVLKSVIKSNWGSIR